MSDVTQLFDLINRSDICKLKQLLSTISDPYQLCTVEHEHEGCSLHWASSHGNNIQILEYLTNVIKLSVDVQQTHGCIGRTALMIACEMGHQDVVLFLLAKKCKINTQDIEGRSALHYGCLSNNLSIIQHLLNSGCEIDLVANSGQTILHFSLSQGTEPIALLLLSKHASPHIIDSKGRTPLHYAVESGCKKVVEKLLNLNCDIEIADKNGDTPLQLVNEGSIYDMLLAHQHSAEQHNMEIKIKNNPKDFVKRRILLSHGNRLISGTFSPGPPTPEAELLKARSKMFGGNNLTKRVNGTSVTSSNPSNQNIQNTSPII